MGLFKSIGGFLGARKAKKLGIDAERHNDPEIRGAFDDATNRLSGFEGQINERSNLASNALFNTLQSISDGSFTPSQQTINAIDDQSVGAKELRAATGRSGGGLAGELERIRTGLILNDSQRQFQNKLAQAQFLSPFATEGQVFQGQLGGLGIEKSNRISANRFKGAGLAAPFAQAQGNALGKTLEDTAKFGANLLFPKPQGA